MAHAPVRSSANPCSCPILQRRAEREAGREADSTGHSTRAWDLENEGAGGAVGDQMGDGRERERGRAHAERDQGELC